MHNNLFKKNSPEKILVCIFKIIFFLFFQIWINTSKMFIIMSRLQQVPPIISLLLIKFLILLQRPLFWVKKKHSYFSFFKRSPLLFIQHKKNKVYTIIFYISEKTLYRSIVIRKMTFPIFSFQEN